MDNVVESLVSNSENMVRDIETLVQMESPSTDKVLLDRVAAYLSEYGGRMLGVPPEMVRNSEAGDNLIFRVNAESKGKPVLILTHYDTVWPQGTVQHMPFSIDGNVITGPGVFDMKSGVIQGFWAMKILLDLGLLKIPVTFMCSSDEETGSEHSRALIEKEAKNSSCVLVLEASKDGMVKTGRKGVGRFTVEVAGRAAHAGLDHKNGISAVEELARTVLELHSMTDYGVGTTVNVGVIRGGTRSNVVAADAFAEIDVRIETMAEAERISRQILGLKPHIAGAELKISGGLNRPPMERTEKNVDLFLKARKAGKIMGIELEDCVVGGASDGNFCSALGIPVLDGMGAVGGNAHAKGEYVLKDTIAQRSALLALLMLELQQTDSRK